MMAGSRDAVTEYAAALNAITRRVNASLERASALPAVDFPASARAMNCSRIASAPSPAR